MASLGLDGDWYLRHQAALMAWAKSQLPDWLRGKVEPADLVQQTLLEAVRDAKRLAGKEDHEVLAFLRRSLSNNLIDATRKFGRDRGSIRDDLAADSSRKLAEWLAASDTSPSERLARNERFARLADGLAELPEAQRIVIEMRFLQGARVAEIARVLQKSEGAISALLHRAVSTLRVELEDLIH